MYLLEFKKDKINMVLIKFFLPSMLEGSTLLDAAKNYNYYFFLINDGIISTRFLY